MITTEEMLTLIQSEALQCVCQHPAAIRFHFAITVLLRDFAK